MELTQQEIIAARDKLSQRLSEVELELNNLQALTQEREILRQTIWGYDELLMKYTGAPMSGYPDRPPVPDSPLWKGAQWVLRRENRPMRSTEIAKRLQELGWKIKSKNPGESLRTILVRKPEMFEKLEGGKYRLKPKE